MRWTRGDRSQDIEDRRGEGPSGRGMGLRVGGGIGLGGALILLVLSLIFGQNFFALLDGGGDVSTGPGGGAASAPPRTASPAEEQRADFVSFVLDDVQNTWTREFQRMGRDYERARLVLFTGGTRSGCGFAETAAGPFYCPEDRKVYIDLGFYDELRSRFGAPGDFAQAYVLAHEIGHHVQHLLGLTDRVRAGQERRPASANALSVRLELQADCLAGVWAHSTSERRLLEEGDVEEALGAAAAVGDDRIQKQAGGRVSPETWTHGSARQRAGWFRRGLEMGRVESCDTFRTALPGVEERAPLRAR
ncbi:MAG TPA: neutral zinc metallopeptidase [Methylomirabilota bacterium]|nr:neutral zinc metallopeptidase [Methylomirabilota bacterium]